MTAFWRAGKVALAWKGKDGTGKTTCDRVYPWVAWANSRDLVPL
jgi:hypothetical protein